MSTDDKDSATSLGARLYSAIYDSFAEIDDPWWIDRYVETSVSKILAILDKDRQRDDESDTHRPHHDESDTQGFPADYLSRRQVAERIGVAPDSLSRYALPLPDATVGRSRGWLPATIDAWNSTRPGRGARTDLS